MSDRNRNLGTHRKKTYDHDRCDKFNRRQQRIIIQCQAKPQDITHVHIILDLPDLYDVELLNISDCGTETLSESYNVCPGDLRKIITEGTGFEIHL
jgi:hypothetical protein